MFRAPATLSLIALSLTGCNAMMTDAPHHEGQNIVYKVDGRTFEGYLVGDVTNAPLVLMVHDWDGLTDYEVRRSNMLAELGYAVFAVDMYGQGVRPTAMADKRAQTSALYGDRPRMRSYLNGAIEEARRRGANTDNTVAMGYCFGGTCVLELARSGADLKGFAPFHGGLETPEGQTYAEVKGSVIVFHGTADSAITMDQFAQFAKELEEHDVDHEMISYGGAPHAFTVFGSDRYREDADRKSWQRFTEYLRETLGK